MPITKRLRVLAGVKADPSAFVNNVALFDAAGNPVVFPQTGANVPHAPFVSATAIGTPAKTVTNAEPAANTLVVLKLTNGNNVANPTVAFNNGTARALQLGGSAPAVGEVVVAANGVIPCWFDGTILHMFGSIT